MEIKQQWDQSWSDWTLSVGGRQSAFFGSRQSSRVCDFHSLKPGQLTLWFLPEKHVTVV